MPQLPVASAIVITQTDKEFGKLADDLKSATKPITDAIKDIVDVSKKIEKIASMIGVLLKAIAFLK